VGAELTPVKSARAGIREAGSECTPDEAMNVKIADLMKTSVLTVQRHHSLAHARKIMQKNAIHALPVTNGDGTLKGIISSHDLVDSYK
jgi:CBS domain-containing protein